MPSGPWQEVSGDIYDPLPDRSYWLVTHCEYSRWVDIEELKSITSYSVIQALKRLFSMIGTPLFYKSDNGPCFSSYEFAQFAKHCGFHHRKITTYLAR